MFLQVCVILFTGGVPGLRGVPGGDPPRTATAAGGTHPTGMHSCLQKQSRKLEGWIFIHVVFCRMEKFSASKHSASTSENSDCF